jgi:hypothetical protein
MPHTNSTTRLNHGGNSESQPSYDIVNHMSGLSMGPGNSSVGTPKPTAGLPKGRLPSDVFAALETLGKGKTNKYGHPVYIGSVSDSKGKRIPQPVAVNVYGLTIKQRQYFCFNEKGNAFDTPPPFSKRDPTPERAERLYEIATALYSGTMAAAPLPEDYYYEDPQTHYDLSAQSGHSAYGHASDNFSTYRPSTASSGGSSGEYTTRPGSRDGTAGHAGYYASAPQTALHDQHYAAASYEYEYPAGDSYGHLPGAHYGAPDSRPSSRGGAAPSHPSAPFPPSVPAGGGGGAGSSKPPAAATGKPSRNAKLSSKQSKR